MRSIEDTYGYVNTFVHKRFYINLGRFRVGIYKWIFLNRKVFPQIAYFFKGALYPNAAFYGI